MADQDTGYKSFAELMRAKGEEQPQTAARVEQPQAEQAAAAPDEQPIEERKPGMAAAFRYYESIIRNLDERIMQGMSAIQADADPADIKKQISMVTFKMGFLQQGVDFLFENGAKGAGFSYAGAQAAALAKAAAGPFKLSMKDTLAILKEGPGEDTEQKRFMWELAGQEMQNRIDRYLGSNYVQALSECMKTFEKCIGVDIEPQNNELWDDTSGAATMIGGYFFVHHLDIKPEDPAALTDQQRGELADMVQALCAYKTEHGGTYVDCFLKRFQIDGKDGKITEITQAEYFDLPIAKLWREQAAIAAAGQAGRDDINVGGQTEKTAVIVAATISDEEGKPIAMDALYAGVERAVAGLAYESGHVRDNGIVYPPINITPQQIYRAFARLPDTATVTEQQAAEMERVMDVLILAPARLYVENQFERHKNIKRQKDVDYNEFIGKAYTGHLIQGTKRDDMRARGGQRVIAYEITKVPMLFYYSHAVGQVARVENVLLTGPGKPAIAEGTASSAQGTARNVVMRTEVLGKILGMESQKKQKKPYTPLIRFDDIALRVGVELTEQSRKTLIKNMGQYLSELQAAGKIAGYEKTKKGRAFVGYTVTLPETIKPKKK